MKSEDMKALFATGVVVLSVGVGIHDGFGSGLIALGLLCAGSAALIAFAGFVKRLNEHDIDHD